MPPLLPSRSGAPLPTSAAAPAPPPAQCPSRRNVLGSVGATLLAAWLGAPRQAYADVAGEGLLAQMPGQEAVIVDAPLLQTTTTTRAPDATSDSPPASLVGVAAGVALVGVTGGAYAKVREVEW